MNLVARLFAFVLLTVGFAWLARRLLGAGRVGWRRSLLAGLAGAAVGLLFAGGLRRWGVDDEASATAAAVIAAVLVSMGLIVAMQLLSQPRARRQNDPGFRASVRAARRGTEVVGILVRHGLGPYVGRGSGTAAATPTQLRQALEESGVVFVKFGQMLAGRPDLIGDDLAHELGKLRHSVTPLGRDEIEAEVRAALPDSAELLDSVVWEPLGSASIAQVYLATRRDGTNVVLKVRRPGVVDEVRRDGEVIRSITRRAERHSSIVASIGIADLADAFVRDLERELDFRSEARDAIDLSASFEGSMIAVPRVYADESNERVLVMDRAAGVPLSDAVLDDWPEPSRRAAAAALLVGNVGAMLAGDRFHADPHPGNVMVDSDGSVALIDFGATGVLQHREREALGSLLMGIQLQQPALLRDSLLAVAQADGAVDVGRLDASIERLLHQHLSGQGEIGPAAVADLLAIMREHDLSLPASSSAMFRSLVTVLDSLERLDPSFSIDVALAEVTPGGEASPTSSDDMATVAKEELLGLVPLLRRAPRLLDSVATQLDRGDLSVRARVLSHPDDVRVITTLVNRAVLAFLAGVLGVVSAMLFAIDDGPRLTDDLTVYDLIASIGLISGAVLLMRVVLEALQHDTSSTPP